MRISLVGVIEVQSFKRTSETINDKGSVEHVQVVGVCILTYLYRKFKVSLRCRLCNQPGPAMTTSQTNVALVDRNILNFGDL